MAIILRTTLSASLAMHVAAAAMVGGHGSAAGVASPTSPVDVVELEPTVLPEVRSDERPPADPPKGIAASAATVPSHRHSYPVPEAHDTHPHDPSLVHLPIAPPAGTPAMTAAPEIDAPQTEPARFVLAKGSAPITVGTMSAGGDRGRGEGASGSAEVVPENAVTIPARLIASSGVTYPPAARQADVEADVPVLIVVDADGRVADARALSASGYGLDDAAIQAVRRYRFTAALKDGRAVRVRMRWVVQFRLR